MICGFLISYLIYEVICYSIKVRPLSNTILTIVGLVGGLVSDIDRWEKIGFHHRRTLHYPVCYAITFLISLVLLHVLNNWIFLMIACFFASSWLYSFMDIFDGFWRDPTKGVYNHVMRRWIKSYNIIPFASDGGGV